MRRLDFLPGDQDRRYMLSYQALCLSNVKLDGIGELTTLVDLTRKFHENGIVANPNRGPNEKALYICPQGGSFNVTDPEWAILKRALVAHIDTCHRALAEELLLAITWANSLPEKTPARVPESNGAAPDVSQVATVPAAP